MSQASITSDRFTNDNEEEQPTVEEDNNTPEPDFSLASPSETMDPDGPRTDSLKSSDFEDKIPKMEFENQADGFPDFPHPAEIRTYVDDTNTNRTDFFTDKVEWATQELDDFDPDSDDYWRSYLAMSAEEVYEYLKSLQWLPDLHVETFHRKQIPKRQLANGNGLSKNPKLSDYDKKKIVRWEIARRMAAKDMDEWIEHKLNKSNKSYPNE